MRRLTRVSVPVLVTLALLAIASPVAAHVSTPPAISFPAADTSVIVPILSAAPTPPTPAWYLPAALVLGAVAAWRRPRRAVVVTLVLLLCVFAFEDALHSVHHGFDVQQQEQCAVAAASAQLSAVQVDGIGLCSVALPVIGEADTGRPAFTLTRFLNPDQQRAPPSATR